MFVLPVRWRKIWNLQFYLRSKKNANKRSEQKEIIWHHSRWVLRICSCKRKFRACKKILHQSRSNNHAKMKSRKSNFWQLVRLTVLLSSPATKLPDPDHSKTKSWLKAFNIALKWKKINFKAQSEILNLTFKILISSASS